MPNPITFTRVDTVTIADLLDGTELEAAPGDGEYQIWGASTQNDTTYKVKRGPDTVIDARKIPLRTNGMVNQSDDPVLAVLEVMSGDRLLITVTVVTAATVQSIVQFVPR